MILETRWPPSNRPATKPSTVTPCKELIGQAPKDEHAWFFFIVVHRQHLLCLVILGLSRPAAMFKLQPPKNMFHIWESYHTNYSTNYCKVPPKNMKPCDETNHSRAYPISPYQLVLISRQTQLLVPAPSWMIALRNTSCHDVGRPLHS